METKIFISHSTAAEDTNLVLVVRNALRAAGLTPVMAVRDYYPGPVSEKVEAAIRGSDYFLALLTQASAGGPWVNQEIGMARGARKRIVVLLEEGVVPPGTIKEHDQIRFARPGVISAANRLTDFLVRDISDRSPLFRLQVTLGAPPNEREVVLRVVEAVHHHPDGQSHPLDRSASREMMDHRPRCQTVGGVLLIRTTYDDRGDLKEMRIADEDLPRKAIKREEGLYLLPYVLGPVPEG